MTNITQKVTELLMTQDLEILLMKAEIKRLQAEITLLKKTSIMSHANNMSVIAELKAKLESADSFINTAPTAKWKEDAIQEMVEHLRGEYDHYDASSYRGQIEEYVVKLGGEE